MEIAKEVEQCLSTIAVANAQVDGNLKRAARLRQSILKRAFEGKLVPQDRTDEPGDKLLERIKVVPDGIIKNRRPARSRRMSKPLNLEE